MKTLAASQCVEIGATSDFEALEASARVIAACPSYGGDPRDLADAVERGEIKANTVVINETASYVVFWRKEMGGCFAIKGTAPLPGGEIDFEKFVGACHQLARENGCTFGMFTSARKGELRLIERLGGKAVAVVYTMPVPQEKR